MDGIPVIQFTTRGGGEVLAVLSAAGRRDCPGSIEFYCEVYYPEQEKRRHTYVLFEDLITNYREGRLWLYDLLNLRGRPYYRDKRHADTE